MCKYEGMFYLGDDEIIKMPDNQYLDWYTVPTPNEERQKSENTENTESSEAGPAEQYSAAEIYEDLRRFYKGLLF